MVNEISNLQTSLNSISECLLDPYDKQTFYSPQHAVDVAKMFLQYHREFKEQL